MAEAMRDPHAATRFRRLLRWLFSADGRLGVRAARGALWLFLGDGATLAAGMLKLAVLARLLSPHDFGLMGIGILVLRWLEHFTESGINKALIRNPGDIRPYLDTAWTVQLVRSVGLALVLYAFAPYGAWFFGNPEATPVIRALALLTLLRGLINPAVVFMPKELDFRRVVAWNLTEVLAGLAVAIPLALLYRNVWALVLSLLAGQAAKTAASFWIEPYWPSLRFDRARAGDLLRFGRWIFGLNVVNFLSVNIDSLFVGKLLGSMALGFYQVGHQVAGLPTREVRTIVVRVMFPTFARLRDQALGRAYLQVLEVVSSIALPVGCLLTVFAGPIVSFLLGDRWLPVVPALQALAWNGVASALTGVAVPLLQAAGRPDVPVKVSVWRVILMVALLYPATSSLGITGAALAVMIPAMLAVMSQTLAASRLGGLRNAAVLAAFKVGALGSVLFLAAGVVAWFLSSAALVVAGGLAVGLYLAALARSLTPYVRMVTSSSSS